MALRNQLQQMRKALAKLPPEEVQKLIAEYDSQPVETRGRADRLAFGVGRAASNAFDSADRLAFGVGRAAGNALESAREGGDRLAFGVGRAAGNALDSVTGGYVNAAEGVVDKLGEVVERLQNSSPLTGQTRKLVDSLDPEELQKVISEFGGQERLTDEQRAMFKYASERLKPTQLKAYRERVRGAQDVMKRLQDKTYLSAGERKKLEEARGVVADDLEKAHTEKVGSEPYKFGRGLSGLLRGAKSGVGAIGKSLTQPGREAVSGLRDISDVGSGMKNFARSLYEAEPRVIDPEPDYARADRPRLNLQTAGGMAGLSPENRFGRSYGDLSRYRPGGAQEPEPAQAEPRVGPTPAAARDYRQEAIDREAMSHTPRANSGLGYLRSREAEARRNEIVREQMARGRRNSFLGTDMGDQAKKRQDSLEKNRRKIFGGSRFGPRL